MSWAEQQRKNLNQSSAPRKEIEWVLYKQCVDCLEFKEATTDNFFRKKNGLFWLTSKCKDCRHKDYMDNIEINKEKSKKYREEHKEEKKQRDAEYRRTHKEYLSEYFKKHRKENIERIKAVQREYYKNNKDKVKGRASKWYEENREYALEKWKERAKEKWYNKLHGAVFRFLHSNNIVFEECNICWWTDNIECHHPDNDIWNEVVVCCRSCHHRIHWWSLECPKPIDLLKYKKQNNEH